MDKKERQVISQRRDDHGKVTVTHWTAEMNY